MVLNRCLSDTSRYWSSQKNTMICIDSNPHLVEVDWPYVMPRNKTKSRLRSTISSLLRELCGFPKQLRNNISCKLQEGVETQAGKCSESRGNYPWVLLLQYLRPRGGQRFASNCDMLKQTNVMKRLENRNNPSAFESQVDFLDMMKGIVWDSKLAIQ